MASPDATHFRTVMGHFATGVAVVTAPGPVGMTANAVASLSLEPLLVLVCFDRHARTLPVVERTGRFAVSVLAAGQEALARRFAGKEEGKFDDVAHSLHDGLPVLDAAIAYVCCTLQELVPGGDHLIGIGSVDAADATPGEPLLWYRGAYGVFRERP